MLFYLDESVKNAHKIGGAVWNKLNCTIDKLITSHFEGTHIVSMKSSTVNFLKSLNCSDYILQTLLSIENDIKEFHSVLDISQNCTHLFFKKPKETVDYSFTCDIELINDFSPSELLCEDYYDSELYAKLSQLILQTDYKNSGLSLKIDKVHGGGSRTAIQLESSLKSSKLGLVITDSDKVHENDCIGSTRISVNKILKKYKKNNMPPYIHLNSDFFEIESIIPLFFYEEIYKSKKIVSFLKNMKTNPDFWKHAQYFPVRKGLSEEKFKKPTIASRYSVWHNDFIANNIDMHYTDTEGKLYYFFSDLSNDSIIENVTKYIENHRITISLNGNPNSIAIIPEMYTVWNKIFKHIVFIGICKTNHSLYR